VTRNAAPATAAPTVIVVDDDADLREALAGLFRSVDLAARKSAAEA
jgi:FixJ family two-component response regulator